jgi:hypothetical protein
VEGEADSYSRTGGPKQSSIYSGGASDVDFDVDFDTLQASLDLF